jgi:hypothetical protein
VSDEVTAVLIAIGVATFVVAGAATRLLGGPYEPVRRILLPFLWIGSREWRTPFRQFARRSAFTRQAWFVAWAYTLMLVLVVMVVLWNLRPPSSAT